MNSYIPACSAGSRAKLVLLMMTGGLLGATGVGAASAVTVDRDVPTAIVRYTRTDLATDSGVQALYRRLTLAANQVCPEQTARGPWMTAAVRKCREQAIAAAVMQINSPQLAAVYSTHSKGG